MNDNEFAERLHYLLTRHIIDTGHAPNHKDLAKLAECSLDEATSGLQRLEVIHGVILEPNSLKVWSLHPFSLIPTAFWVSTGNRGWWANCAWCSLGIAAAIGSNANISTSDGAEGVPLSFDVIGGKVTGADLLMHFPYPPKSWWDNPYCPCGNILFFSTEQKIEAWCLRHHRPKGAVLPMNVATALAERWFGDYASPHWRRKTVEQATNIFAELKLDPSFWNIAASFR